MLGTLKFAYAINIGLFNNAKVILVSLKRTKINENRPSLAK